MVGLKKSLIKALVLAFENFHFTDESLYTFIILKLLQNGRQCIVLVNNIVLLPSTLCHVEITNSFSRIFRAQFCQERK